MRERLVAATPLISLLLFLFSGFVLDSWGMGLSFFLLIPLSLILLTQHYLQRLNQMMPLIALLVFLWLHFGADLAHPGWVVFFAIPISDTVIGGKINAKKFVTLSITLGYIVLGFLIEGFWHPGWLIFLLIPIINILFFPSQTMRFYSSRSKTFKSTFYRFVNAEDDVVFEEED